MKAAGNAAANAGPSEAFADIFRASAQEEECLHVPVVFTGKGHFPGVRAGGRIPAASDQLLFSPFLRTGTLFLEGVMAPWGHTSRQR